MNKIYLTCMSSEKFKKEISSRELVPSSTSPSVKDCSDVFLTHLVNQLMALAPLNLTSVKELS